jgi:hypothetical protein
MHCLTFLLYGFHAGSCIALTHIKIPESVTRVGEGAFSKCQGLRTIIFEGGDTQLGVGSMKGCVQLTSVSLPSYLKVLPSRCLEDCETLPSLDLPDTLVEIMEGACIGIILL